MNGHDGAQDDCSLVVTGMGPVFLLEDLAVMCTNIGEASKMMSVMEPSRSWVRDQESSPTINQARISRYIQQASSLNCCMVQNLSSKDNCSAM